MVSFEKGLFLGRLNKGCMCVQEHCWICRLYVVCKIVTCSYSESINYRGKDSCVWYLNDYCSVKWYDNVT